MKNSHFIIVFSTLLIASILLVSFTVRMNKATTDLSLEYKKNMDVAVEDAIEKVIQTYGTNVLADGTYWNSYNMNTAKKTFLSSLAAEFNYPVGLGQDELYLHVPVLMFIDFDGFYCVYVDSTEDENGHSNFEKHLSDKFLWEEDLENGAHIKYTIEDIIYVTMPDGTTYNGHYEKLYQKLTNKGLSGFDILSTASLFEVHKTDLIISKIENNLNYFLNLADTSSDRTGKFYNVHMDYTNDELQDIKNKAILDKDENATKLEDTGTTQQIIDNIGMIAFFQGATLKNNKDIIDIYAMNCRIVDTSLTIPVTLDEDSGEFEYHDTRLCNKWTGRDNQVAVFLSQEEAASYGAYPCETCW